MTKSSKRGADWTPRGNVQFQPVPYALLPVVDTGSPGQERCGDGCGEYSWHLFDPWQRGDLVAICCQHTAWHQGEGHKSYESWHIGRRATVPSAITQKIDCGGASLVSLGRGSPRADLYRIPYRYRQAAEKLIGKEFSTREALEAAMSGLSQQVAA